MDNNKKRLIDQVFIESKKKGLSYNQAKKRAQEEVNNYNARFGSEDDSFLMKLGKTAISPITKSVKNVAGLGHHLVQSADIALTKDPLVAAQKASQQNPYFTQREFEQFDNDPLRALYEQGAKPAAGTLAYAVPVGKAATIGQAAKLGAGAGMMGAFGATAEQATPLETALNVGVGGVVGAGTAAATKAVSNKISKVLQDRATRKALESQYGSKVDALYKQPGGKKLAARLIAEQNPVHKNKFTTSQKPMKTYQEMADLGLFDRDEWLQAREVLTGGDGLIDDLHRKALSKTKPPATDALLKHWSNNNSKYPSSNKLNGWVKGVLSDMAYTDPKTGNVNFNQSDPTKFYTAMKQIERMAFDLRKNAPIAGMDFGQEMQSKALMDLSNEMSKRLYTDAGLDDLLVKQVLKGINPATGQIDDQLVQNLNGIKALYPKVWEQIMKVKSNAELRTVAAPFVRAGNLAEASYLADTSQSRAIASQISGRGLGKFGGLDILKNILGSKPVTYAAASAANKAGNLQAAAQPVTEAVGRGLGAMSTRAARTLPAGTGILTPELIESFARAKSRNQGRMLP